MGSGKTRLNSWFKPSPRTKEWPAEFICPISKSGMADPVIVCSGQSYERRCLEAWMTLGRRYCFVHGTDLANSTVISNVALKTAISNWCQAAGLPKPLPPDQEAAKSFALDLINSADSENGHRYNSHERLEPLSPGSDSGIAASASSVSLHGPPTPSEARAEVLSDEFRKLTVGPPMARYSHSATQVNLLRNSCSSSSSSSSSGDMSVPLPLATKPVSYSSQPREIVEVRESSSTSHCDSEIVSELAGRLRQSRALEQEEAAADLRKLTRSSVESRLILCHPKLLSALLPLLTSRYCGVQVNAVAALVNLSLEMENKVSIVRAGAIPYLIDVLKAGHHEAQEHAAGGIFSLALNDDNKIAIGVLGAVPPLIHILRSGQERARQDAAMALYHLSFASSNRSKLVKAGAVPILMDIAQDEKSGIGSRVLMILCNIASISEGRKALLDANAIASLVGILAKHQKDRNKGGREIQEQAVAVLLLLSQNNLRFVALAIQAGAMEPLVWLAENGNARAKEKASALLSMIRELPADEEECADSILPRSHQRRLGKGDLFGPNSTDF